MSRNLDDVLVTSGVIPSIPAGEVRDVQADLLLNGQPAIPLFVDVDGPCAVLAVNGTGVFTTANSQGTCLGNTIDGAFIPPPPIGKMG